MRITHRFKAILYLQFLLIVWTSCYTSQVPSAVIVLNASVAAVSDSSKSQIAAVLYPYQKQIKDSFSAIIGINSATLSKEKPAGSLGNLITEAMFLFAQKNLVNAENSDDLIVFMNPGGIRLKELPKGEISIGKIFELLPFENTLVEIEIKGADVKSLLIETNKLGAWPIYFNTKKLNYLGDLELSKTYRLITNNYLAQGGDNCTILKSLPQRDSNKLLREIVIEYIQKKGNIWPNNSSYYLGEIAP